VSGSEQADATHDRDPSDERRALCYPVDFRGNAKEYFPIWIVNVALCILTLFIYSPWAKVRAKRYFYGNTYIDNSNFDYLARPIQILKGRVIAVIALIIVTVVSSLNYIVGLVFFSVLIIVTPWVVWRSLRFNARMSSFRNLRFGFQQKLLPLYGIMILAPGVAILVIVAMGSAFALALGLVPERIIAWLVGAGTFVLPRVAVGEKNDDELQYERASIRCFEIFGRVSYGSHLSDLHAGYFDWHFCNLRVAYAFSLFVYSYHRPDRRHC